nr:hypothetical protein [Ruegeria sp. A3M17]
MITVSVGALADQTVADALEIAVGEGLKLRQLRLLVAVGAHGNIQNAAQELDDLHEGNSGRVVVGTF